MSWAVPSGRGREAGYTGWPSPSWVSSSTSCLVGGFGGAKELGMT